MPLAMGFIGAGTINRAHMENARQLGFDLVGVADTHRPSAEEAGAKVGIKNVYEDFRELLANTSIDAVIVGTPNKFHAEQAIAALNAGKHVLLEKPMAMNVAECDQILAAVSKSGRTLQMGMANRFKAAPRALKKFVESGRCGKIYSAQSFWFRRRGIPGFGGWATNKKMAGGGALVDIGVHLLDLAMYMMDFPEPESVTGATYNIWSSLDEYRYLSMWGKPVPGGKKDVEDYALATIRFVTGQTLQLNVSWAINVAVQPDAGVRLMGDKGGAELKGLDELIVYGEEAGQLVDIKPQFVPVNELKDELADFAACIRDKRTPIATAGQGRAVQAILDAIYASDEQKREIRFERKAM